MVPLETKKKVVLCVGDSLGLPRRGVTFQSTWLYKISLQFQDYLFINNFAREFTSEGLNSEDSLEMYLPSVVIVQVGIVDCAPRFHHRDSLLFKLVNSTPNSFKALFWRIFKKIRTRRIKYAFVDPIRFRFNLENYLLRCQKIGVEQVVFILIQIPGSQMLSQNHQILESIGSYNEIIMSIAKKYGCDAINPLRLGGDENYVEDGYHLNEAGFDRVLADLTNVLLLTV